MKQWDSIIKQGLTHEEAILGIDSGNNDSDKSVHFFTRQEWDGFHFISGGERCRYSILTKDGNLVVNPGQIMNQDDSDWMIVTPTDDALNILKKYNVKLDKCKVINSAGDKIRGFEIISKKQYDEDFDKDDAVEIKLPKRSTKLSAGYDVFAPLDIFLMPGEEIKVPTGIRAYMQPGEVLLAFPRSGLGFKYYCRLANTIGVIDADYYYSDNEGHMFMKIRNEGSTAMAIKQGDAFAQLIFMPFLLIDGDDYSNGNDRNGGFGSTTERK